MNGYAVFLCTKKILFGKMMLMIIYLSCQDQELNMIRPFGTRACTADQQLSNTNLSKLNEDFHRIFRIFLLFNCIKHQ